MCCGEFNDEFNRRISVVASCRKMVPSFFSLNFCYSLFFSILFSHPYLIVYVFLTWNLHLRLHFVLLASELYETYIEKMDWRCRQTTEPSVYMGIAYHHYSSFKYKKKDKNKMYEILINCFLFECVFFSLVIQFHLECEQTTSSSCTTRQSISLRIQCKIAWVEQY